MPVLCVRVFMCSVCARRPRAVPKEHAEDIDAPADDFGDGVEYKGDDVEFLRGADDTRGSSIGLGRLSFGPDGRASLPPQDPNAGVCLRVFMWSVCVRVFLCAVRACVCM